MNLGIGIMDFFFILSLVLMVGSNLGTHFFPHSSILSTYCMLGIVGSVVSIADTGLPS